MWEDKYKLNEKMIPTIASTLCCAKARFVASGKMAKSVWKGKDVPTNVQSSSLRED